MNAYQQLTEIQSDLTANKFNLVELVQFYLNNIQSNKKLNAFLEVFDEEALKRAEELQKKIGER